MTAETERLAVQIWRATLAQEQCALPILDDDIARAVRARVRELARADGINVRTARIDDSVVVVRLDARVWKQDAATMRRKLTPG